MTTSTTPDRASAARPRPDSATTDRRRWWRRPWVVPLALVAAVFLAFSLPPYLSLEPARSRVPSTFALHFPLLVAHVMFASVAMLTCVFQVWPWFRNRYRTAHRVMGRVYVFGGVLPAGILGTVIGMASPFGPTVQVSGMLLGPLWLVSTVVGWRMARQRRYAEHRRWMLRSFALTFSIVTNRVWGVVMAIVLYPQLDTTFGGSEVALQQAMAGVSAWLGWVVPLLIVQWWLEREDAAKHRARIARRAAGSRETGQPSAAR